MRWTDTDPNGYTYWKRKLTAYGDAGNIGSRRQKKWNISDFPSTRKGEEVFNFHFEGPGTSRMTNWELTYLHSLIEEYKEVGGDLYRKLEIWRALNWAPVFQQFAFVMPFTNKSALEQQKWAVDFSIERYGKSTPVTPSIPVKSTFKSFKGFWVEQFNESIYNADDKNIMSLYKFSPKTPSQNYPNHNLAGIKAVVPAFVLPRTYTPWEINPSIFVTKPDGSPVPKKLQKPWDVDTDGNIRSIGNLDGIIRAKMYGWKINGQEIPDQEIVHYIRRKYGFGHAVNDSVNKNTGLPQAHWYVIPFFDNEPNKSLNVGQYIPNQELQSEVLVDKTTSITSQIITIKNNLRYNSKNVFVGSENVDYYNDVIGITNKLIPKKINDNNKEANNYLPTWNQIFYFSTIRAYWRASRILEETYRYSKYMEEGIRGDKPNVLIVSGEIKPRENSTDFDDAMTAMHGTEDVSRFNRNSEMSLFFISNKKSGISHHESNHIDEDSRVSARIDIPKLSHHLNFEERPWNKIFKYSKEGQNAYATDRSARKRGECFNTTQYMRNIIIPNVSPYISDILYDTEQILYTKKALDNRSLFYRPLWETYLNSNGINKFEKEAVQIILGKSLESIKYNDYLYALKKYKSGIFTVSIASVILATLIHTTFHHSTSESFRKFAHNAHHFAHMVEGGLTASKIYTNIYTGYILKAARDFLIYELATWLSKGAPVLGGEVLLIGETAGTIIGIGITIAVFLYDRWSFAQDKLAEMDELVKLFNEATELGVLEGPFAQTKGVVKIKKGANGSLPIGVKKSPDGKTVVNEYQNFQSPESKIDNETQQQRIDRLNKEFLQPNSRWETTFFNQIQPIECKTLLDIAKKLILPNGKYNSVLNESPNHIDVGAFKPKESGKLKDVVWENWDLYLKYSLNDVQNIEPDGFMFYNENEFIAKSIDDELRKSSVPKSTLSDRGAQIIRTKFKYTRKTITTRTDLTSYFNGTEIPSEFIIVGRKTSSPVFYNYNIPVKITDKEKVYLIRKKYGLDEVIPGGNCCSVFDVPADKNIFPITTDCQYLYDFTSPAFIKKLEDFCGKTEEDKNKENEKKNKASKDDVTPATKHGITEELRVQHEIKLADANAQMNRRDLKRKGTDGRPRYEGTADSTRNLGQLPRFGIQAVIPGNTDTFSLPMTDSESQQDIAFEFIDTERSAAADFIANLVINYVGSTLSKLTYQIKETETPSTPLTPGKKTYEKVYYLGNKRIT